MHIRLLVISAVSLSACSSNWFDSIARNTWKPDTQIIRLANNDHQSSTILKLKIASALNEAEQASEVAVASLNKAIGGVTGGSNIEKAKSALFEAKSKEHSIRNALTSVGYAIKKADESQTFDENGDWVTIQQLDTAEVATEIAAQTLGYLRDQGLGPQDIAEAEDALLAATSTEQNIREALQAQDSPKFPTEATDDDEPKETSEVVSLDAAEEATISAVQTLDDYREAGLGPRDIEEAEAVVEQATALEQSVRDVQSEDNSGDALGSEEKTEKGDQGPSKVEGLDAAERATDAARSELTAVQTAELGPKDIEEAKVALHEAEETEADVRKELSD